MSLPPVDPERNARILAERLNWPDGALQACTDLGARHPRWTIWYSHGGVPRDPDPGYRAVLQDPYPRTSATARLAAPTPEELSRLIEEDERRYPPRSLLTYPVSPGQRRPPGDTE